MIFSALGFAAVTFWLLDHLRPRHSHFLAPRAPITSEAVLEESTTPEGFYQSLVELHTRDGLTVRFRLLRPAQIARPVPLLILLAGHRTGSNAVDLIGDPGEVALAALDYPYDGPQKIRNAWQGLSNLGAMQQALLDTPVAVSIALDWLIKQPWVDTNRVELIGASLGTPFAAVAGALDERFRRVWFLHGGADNRAWLEETLRERITSRPARAAAARLLHLIAHGASFDTPMWTARIAPRAVVVVGASDDESLTRENIERLHAAAGEPKELLWTSGGHVKRHRPEIVRQLLDLVRKRIASESSAAT